MVVHPGHGAPQHEGLGLEALLRGSLHVGGLGRVLDLLVVGQAPAEVVVLLEVAQRLEGVEVVHPLLHGDVAGAVDALAQAMRERRLHRCLALRVLGAVLEAGEVLAEAGVAPAHAGSR